MNSRTIVASSAFLHFLIHQKYTLPYTHIYVNYLFISDRKNLSNSLQVQWKGNQKLLHHIEELGAYVTAFDDVITSTRGSHHAMLREKGASGDVNFVSKAYIERSVRGHQ